jgi:hypothetical protein
MIVSVNQPAYLPWLGYFHRIAVSDAHVVLDHVQFEKNSVTNRNKVRTADGWCWLTVPLKTKGRFGHLAIRSVEIDNATDWRARHWKTLRQSYAHAPHFADHAAYFESVYARDWGLLADLLRDVTAYLLCALGITTPLTFSSDMAPQGAKDELVLDLCRKAHADLYLSGAHGRNYLREELFQRAGIAVAYQQYRHPEYRQVTARDFAPAMSVVDLLFNHGPRSLEVVMKDQEPVEVPPGAAPRHG